MFRHNGQRIASISGTMDDMHISLVFHMNSPHDELIPFIYDVYDDDEDGGFARIRGVCNLDGELIEFPIPGADGNSPRNALIGSGETHKRAAQWAIRNRLDDVLAIFSQRDRSEHN